MNPHTEFRALAGPARAAVALLSVAGLGHVLSIVGAGQLLALLDRVERRLSYTEASIDAVDALNQTAAYVNIGCLLVAGFAFVLWFHRAYTNLPALGVEDLRFSSGWAIGSWFVPFLSLVRPKQISDDIWRSTAPDLPFPALRAQWNGSVVPVLHNLWWAAFLSSNIAGVVARRLGAGTTLASLRSGATATIVTDVLAIVAAVLAMRVVHGMTRRVQARRVLALAAAEH